LVPAKHLVKQHHQIIQGMVIRNAAN